MDWFLLLGAACLAGALNAIAGGGSLITLPALLYAGLPPVAANATGTVALLPGYLASAWGYRGALAARNEAAGSAEPDIQWPRLLLICGFGGAVGGLLLVASGDRLFESAVPWLMLFASLLFAFGEHLQRVVRRFTGKKDAAGATLLFAASVYGGYFNGGLGIVLLAVLSLLGFKQIDRMNGLKNLLSAQLTMVAVLIYLAGGAVHWRPALVMMIGAIAGGAAGAQLGQRIPARWVRALIVAAGLLLAAVFFTR